MCWLASADLLIIFDAAGFAILKPQAEFHFVENLLYACFRVGYAKISGEA
jgi:hypothetical protein